jgi:hypothetical protein
MKAFPAAKAKISPGDSNFRHEEKQATSLFRSSRLKDSVNHSQMCLMGAHKKCGGKFNDGGKRSPCECRCHGGRYE